MISRAITVGLRERPPYFTLAMMATVLVTSVPQLFLGDVYDALTGTLFGPQVPHYLTLPLFSHSPDILAAHLLGNLAVLALFGGLSEIVLGPRRFAVLTLTAAAVSLAFSYLRGLSEVHGVSGVAWAFHVPALLALIVMAERRSTAQRLLRDPLLWAYAAFYLLDFVFLPLFEVVAFGWRFFENFGQVQHLAAVTSAVPFVLVWRRPIEERAAKLCGAGASRTGGPASDPSGPTHSPMRGDAPVSLASRTSTPPWQTRLPQTLFLVLLAVNLAGTADAVALSLRADDTDTARYTVSPTPDTPAAEVGSTITVTFSEDMATREVNVRRRSIWYQHEPAPRLNYRWRGPRELAVVLSRPLKTEEAIVLELDVYRAGPRTVPVPVPVDISYGKEE